MPESGDTGDLYTKWGELVIAWEHNHISIHFGNDTTYDQNASVATCFYERALQITWSKGTLAEAAQKVDTTINEILDEAEEEDHPFGLDIQICIAEGLRAQEFTVDSTDLDNIKSII
ncbi:MAG TPA: hypothetical protein VGA67_05890 [Candidatus Dojkabacteria bacterium]